MSKLGIWGVVALANAVALSCAINPRIDRWRSHGVVVFVIEAILFPLALSGSLVDLGVTTRSTTAFSRPW
jgi:hypothetical protein